MVTAIKDGITLTDLDGIVIVANTEAAYRLGLAGLCAQWWRDAENVESLYHM